MSLFFAHDCYIQAIFIRTVIKIVGRSSLLSQPAIFVYIRHLVKAVFGLVPLNR